MPRTRTTAVTGSPAAAAETTIATIAAAAVPAGQSGDPVDLIGEVDITIGTNGTTVTLKIERGDATVLATVGPITTAGAATRFNAAIMATDREAGLGYLLTATVANGSAVSTVNQVNLLALW
jgi:hypothetical protein